MSIMKAMSFILKLVSIIGILLSVHGFLSGEAETAIMLFLGCLIILATGVLFKNLAEAFEDIALIRERQKLELMSKGILGAESANNVQTENIKNAN
jgi:high-affinity K+ transport system ATPase subunit B